MGAQGIRGRALLLVSIAAALVVLGVTLALVTRSGETSGLEGADRSVAPDGVPGDAAGLEGEDGGASGEIEVGREAAGTEDRAGSRTKPAPRPPKVPRARGRVVDVVGAPLAGVVVGPEESPEIAVATSGPDGSFAAELAHMAAGSDATLAVSVTCLIAVREAHAAVRKGCVGAGYADAECVVVCAPAIAVSGAVVDETGTGIEGARVSLEPRPDLYAGFPLVLDATEAVEYAARTLPDGSFELSRIPSAEGLLLRASHPGYEDGVRDVPARSGERVVFALARTARRAPDLTGIVRLASGKPAPLAVVRFGDARTSADEHGRFALVPRAFDRESPLVAVLPGLLPAIVPRFGELLAQSDMHPAPVELVLGGPALAIAGRVVGNDAKPCAGWRVGLADGTRLVAGRFGADVLESMVRDESVETDTLDDGGFRIEGLLERSYVLQAVDPATLVAIRSEPIPAGSRDIVLTVPADALRESVAGVVMSRGGIPLAGVGVRAMVVSAQDERGTLFENGPETTTDAQGRFELARVPRQGLFLWIDAEDVIPETVAVPPEESGEAIAVEVAQRCHFRFEAAGDPAPDAIAALGPGGDVLPIFTFSATGSSSASRASLAEGRSRTFAVSEDARSLVMYRGSEEVGRVQVRLVPGEVAVVRP